MSRPYAASAEPRTPSRCAAMGLVDASETATPNLDEALSRRRADG